VEIDISVVDHGLVDGQPWLNILFYHIAEPYPNKKAVLSQR